MPMINNSVSIIQKWLNSGGDLSQLLKNYNGKSIQEIIEEINKKADTKTKSGGFIGGSEAITTSGGAIGYKAITDSGGAVGNNANSATGGAIGTGAKTASGGSVGRDAKSGMGFSGGYNAQVDKDTNNNYINAIQLGQGTNNKPKTLQVYDYTMMNEDGSIPEERLSKAKDYIDGKIGDIDTLLDSILAIEQELIGEALVDTSIAVCDSYINGGVTE